MGWHICVCANRRYVELASVMLKSLDMNGGVPEAKILVVSDGLRPSDKSVLENCAGKQIDFVELDGEIRQRLLKLPTHNQYNVSVWAPVIIPNLPQLSGRAVILDADMVILRSIRDLFTEDLAPHGVGAVQDPCPYEYLGPRNVTLGRSPDAPYFNSGMLVVDVGSWRSARITERALEWALQQTRRTIRFPDQDTLNKILDGNWKPLPLAWNFHSIPLERASARDYEGCNILHFILIKPDHQECTHPAKHLYFRYRERTPFATKPLVSRSRRLWRRRVSQIRERTSRLAKELRRVRAKLAAFIGLTPAIPRETSN